jgi:hypothetical protein
MKYTSTLVDPKTFTWGCVSVKKLIYMTSKILHLISFTNEVYVYLYFAHNIS